MTHLASRIVLAVKRDQFLLVAEAVATKADGDLARIGHLIMRNAGHSLKEPQLRHLWALECDRLGQYYTFEGPTKRKYHFGDAKSCTLARHDLVLYEIELHKESGGGVEERLTRAVVELKHGLALNALNNDLAKFMGECAEQGLTGMAWMIVDEHPGPEKLGKYFAHLPGHLEQQLTAVDEQVDGGRKVGEDDPWLEILVVVRAGAARGLYRGRLDCEGDRDLTISRLRESPGALRFDQVRGPGIAAPRVL